MNRTEQPEDGVPVLWAALAAVVVAVMGFLATDLDGWYAALQKPAWQPPNWLFGPVWTLIYALAALAGVRAWRGAPDDAASNRVLGLFMFNAFLNVFWSLLFFRLHRPDLALIEVAFLWISIVVLIFGVRPYARSSTWLLLPYLAWVSFAAVLNAAIVQLNPGL